MTSEIEGYGSQIARLPRWLVRPSRRARDEGPLVRWGGVDGVRSLSVAEHVKLYSESVAKFPRDGWGSIDWTRASGQKIVHRYDVRSEGVDGLLDRLVDCASSVVIIWQSAVYPSLEVATGLVQEHWDELIDVDDEFYLYIPANHVFIERGLDDSIRVVDL